MSKAWEATVRKSKKRANSIFSSMSVAHADDEDNSEIEHTEMNLSNGDYYNGQWADNFPTGQGKYIWTDGCMYVGEWFRGKTMGRGRFSWPTGATYEGDFKNGYMDGRGTYIGSFGDTYRGSWLMNLKHGKGIKSYANGDWYEGEWRKGTQNGQGRYQWKNGNSYAGRWRNGLMNGEGTMIWADGNRYDGSWEGGLPKGTGTFKRYDESFYVGNWSNNPKDQSGTYYPVSSGDKNWDPQEVFSLVSNGCKICPDEKVLVLPSQKVYNWFSSKGSSRPRRTSLDDRFSNYKLDQCDSSDVSESLDGNLREVDEGLGNLNINEAGSRTTRMPPVRIHPVKSEGIAITKGHKNYDLMLNLQLGVRHTVGKPAPATTSLDLKGSAFDPNDKVWTKFPCAGSKYTLPHTSTEFKWKDYCPVVFRTLRKLFGVDPADYMLSICGSAALRELSSQGKSGSFFYLTHDDRYMIKTVKKAENKLLLRMLPAYYNHVRAFENTLVTKFYGLHCVKPTAGSQKKVRFVIMGNLFCSKYTIHRRFDLKGSSYGRTTDRQEAEIDQTRTLKDLDLNFIFRLQKIWFQDFCRQVDRDCDFLEQERIMDYSMLVGIHFCETAVNSETQMAEACPRTPRAPTSARSQTGNGDVDHNNGGVRLSRADVDHFYDPSRWPSIRLGVNMPAMVEQTVRTNDNDSQHVGEPSGEYYEVILYFGIIDILQDYDISKKLEHAYKSIQHDPTSISAVDPKQYSKRFRDFIFKIFTQDTR